MVDNHSVSVGQEPRSPSYPDELVKALLPLWDDGDPPKPVQIAPDRRVLSELIHVAYQTSLTKEEGKPTQVSIILTNDRKAHRLGFVTFRFDAARAFSAGELRRLGPATIPDQTAVAVTAEDGNLIIWGLVDLRNVKPNLDLQPPTLIVSVRAPGWIDVDIPLFRSFVLRDGGFDVDIPLSRSLVLRDGVVAARSQDPLPLVSPFINRAAKRIAERRALHHPQIDAGEFRQTATKVVAGFVRSVTDLLRKANHGATVILVPAESETRVRELVRFKYSLRMEPLAEAAEFATNWLTLQPPRETRRETLEELEDPAIEPGIWTRDLFQRMLVHHTETFANLSFVDGVAVVTDELYCLGFGGQILKPGPAADRVTRFRTFQDLTDSPELVRIDEFGTRHRSALALCDDITTAVALVVSQDGGLRVIGNVEQHGLSIVERS